ncbi:MAG: DUF456 family protein [Clostridia bacterium]|nr:DUF456 family protein [Clostridia bacterium]MDH7572898.1 DUF456 family protein [Clostridia bacterium]
MEAVALLVAVVLFLAGLAGILLPVLPGHPLIWLGMLFYGLLTGFESISWPFLLWQGLLALAGVLVDYLAGAWGVRRYGGSRAAVWGAVGGAIVGGLALGPLGILVGPLAGAVGAELVAGRSPAQALRVGLGTLVGFLGGLVLKFGLAAAMIVWFFLAVW